MRFALWVARRYRAGTVEIAHEAISANCIRLTAHQIYVFRSDLLRSLKGQE